MSDLRVFLSYNLSPNEMVVAWRLQTLASAHGITLYVPHPDDRRSNEVPQSAKQMIDASNIVVAFCTRRFSKTVQREISYAIEKGKPVLPILEAGLKLTGALRAFPVVAFSPRKDQPGDLETRLIEHLKKYRKRYQLKEKQSSALGLLLGIGAGLLLLWALTGGGKK